MKFIKQLNSRELEIEAENVLESLYEIEECIEFDGEDYHIISKEGRKYRIRKL